MMRHTIAVCCAVFFHVWLFDGSSSRAAQAPMPDFTYRPGAGKLPTSTQPPWHQTQERRPKEVKDKENETPLTSCENTNALTGEKISTVNYLDNATGATTTIRRIDIPEQPRIGSPLPAKTIWEIVTQQVGQPKKKITYDLEPGKETRTEKSGNNKPNTRQVTGDDMYSPEVKKGSLPFVSDNLALARIIQREAEPVQRRRGASPRSFAAVAPMFGAPTSAASATPGQPGGLSITMKSDAWGEPPKLFFALSDVSPPMSADEYVLSQALGTLEDEWQSYGYYGPGVFYPGDTFTTSNGQHIEIVGDWSLARVPGGFLMSCGGFDFDDEDDGWQTQYKLKYEKIEYR